MDRTPVTPPFVRSTKQPLMDHNTTSSTGLSPLRHTLASYFEMSPINPNGTIKSNNKAMNNKSCISTSPINNIRNVFGEERNEGGSSRLQHIISPSHSSSSTLSFETKERKEEHQGRVDLASSSTLPSDPGEEESIALARMLMAEEAIESYGALSQDYLRYNANQYSREDLAAFQAVLQENDDTTQQEEGLGGYDMMLRLGDAIGDVKQERWALVANNHINKLPTFCFEARQVGDNDNDDDCRQKCLICQFPYQEGEELRQLPCSHCFHKECIDTWLKDKDFCVYCRQPIIMEKECNE